MVPTTGLAIAIALADRKYGFDRHAWDLTPELAVQSRELAMAASSLYIFSTGLTKISILFFYRRLGSGSLSKWYLTAVKASIAFVFAYMITFELTLFFGCTPIHAYWMQVDFHWYLANKSKFHCMDEGADYMAASVISVVQDFLACCLPIMIMWTLQIPKRQKIALGGVFGVGLFLCLIGILRIHQIQIIYYQTYDLTWAAGPGWAWTAVEAHVAIICASAPSLKPFFRRVLVATGYGSGSRFTGAGGGGNYYNGYGARSGNAHRHHGRSHTCKEDCAETSIKMGSMGSGLKKGATVDVRESSRSGDSSTDEESEIQSPSHLQRSFQEQIGRTRGGARTETAVRAEGGAGGAGQLLSVLKKPQSDGVSDYGIRVTNEVDVSVSKTRSKSSTESLL
ncbi:hypothetical protein SLS57_011269 [Botryosphaeria dothidea]